MSNEITLTFDAPEVNDPIVNITGAEMWLDRFKATITFVRGQGEGDHYSVAYFDTWATKGIKTTVVATVLYETAAQIARAGLVDMALTAAYQAAAMRALADMGRGAAT